MHWLRITSILDEVYNATLQVECPLITDCVSRRYRLLIAYRANDCSATTVTSCFCSIVRAAYWHCSYRCCCCSFALRECIFSALGSTRPTTTATTTTHSKCELPPLCSSTALTRTLATTTTMVFADRFVRISHRRCEEISEETFHLFLLHDTKNVSARLP